MEALALEEINYQPRYVSYAESHGREPSEQLEVDRERFPGGCMTGFLLWSGQRISEWSSLTGRSRSSPLTTADQDEYAKWLNQWVTENRES